MDVESPKTRLNIGFYFLHLSFLLDAPPKHPNRQNYSSSLPPNTIVDNSNAGKKVQTKSKMKERYRILPYSIKVCHKSLFFSSTSKNVFLKDINYFTLPINTFPKVCLHNFTKVILQLCFYAFGKMIPQIYYLHKY